MAENTHTERDNSAQKGKEIDVALTLKAMQQHFERMNLQYEEVREELAKKKEGSKC